MTKSLVTKNRFLESTQHPSARIYVIRFALVAPHSSFSDVDYTRSNIEKPSTTKGFRTHRQSFGFPRVVMVKSTSFITRFSFSYPFVQVSRCDNFSPCVTVSNRPCATIFSQMIVGFCNVIVNVSEKPGRHTHVVHLSDSSRTKSFLSVFQV